MSTRVGFETTFVSDSITRPANTTAYAAGDVISEVTNNDHFTFLKAVNTVPGKSTGTLNTVRLISSANQSTKLDAELWLFHTDIAEVADNSAFAPTDAEVATLVAIVSLPDSMWLVGNATSGAGGNAVIEVTEMNIPIKGDSGTIYGQLVARNAYTPVSGEIFTCQLAITQD